MAKKKLKDQKPGKHTQFRNVDQPIKPPHIVDIDRIAENIDVSTNIDHVIDTIDLSGIDTSFEPVHIDRHNVLLTEQARILSALQRKPRIGKSALC